MATEEQMIGALRQAHEAGDVAGATRIAGMIKDARTKAAPPPAAPNTYPADSTIGRIYAAAHSFEDTATLGVGDRAIAAATYGAKRLLGKKTTYNDEYQAIQSNAKATTEANPITSGIGTAAGIISGAGALSAGAKAAEAVPVVGSAVRALTPKSGQLVRNLARTATTGAAVGAADAAGHGGDSEDALLSAGAGAVGGPIMAAAGHTAAKVIAPASVKAMRLLADKIGEPPELLTIAFQKFKGATGRFPSLAEIVGMKSRGELRQMAADNSTIGEAAYNKVQSSATASPERTLPASANAPEDMNSLVTRRKDRMDAAMAPIRGSKVPVTSDELSLLMDRRVRAATNADPVLQKKIQGVINDLSPNAPEPFKGHTIQDYLKWQALNQPTESVSHRLTVDDFDNIRKSLRGRQSAFANPQSSSHNPHIARRYGELADNLTGLATDAEKGYQTALDQFGSDSNYIKGFKHGNAGKPIAAADKPELIRALNTPEGKAGHLTGSTERQAAANLREVAPGVSQPAGDTSLEQAAHGAAAVTYGSPAARFYHLSRIIPHLKMSESVQRKVADMLFDPKQTAAAIAQLRRGGASNADLHRLALGFAAVTGGAAGNALTEGK